jgi:uncharacterized protein Yka (UPF0111/DUF47 family)
MIKKWLLLKTADINYPLTIEKCTIEHKKAFPNNELGIRLNNDNSLALVKVCTEEEDFFDVIAESVISNIYTEETHSDAIDLMNTPEWIVDEGDYNG